MPEQTTLVLAGSLGAVGIVSEEAPPASDRPQPAYDGRKDMAAETRRVGSQHPGEAPRSQSCVQ